MARSLRFGSAPRYYGRPIQTRFRYGSGPKALDLATEKQLAGSLCKRHAVARLAPKDKHSASTVCRRTVSGTISLPLLGFFSPFPHGTSSLSVAEEYLALEGGPPGFRRDFTCPVLLRNGSGGRRLSSTGLSPTMARLSCAVQLAFAFVTPI